MRWLVQRAKRDDLDQVFRDPNSNVSPAYHGNRGMVKFLFECDLVQEPVEVFEMAALRGHLHIIKWLHEEGRKWLTESLPL
ncbi:hypothetical protein PI126_g17404 [Phytophthora idaei]|nr:hypothetical protein PI126_g17404 [Phytophthora idaei]